MAILWGHKCRHMMIKGGGHAAADVGHRNKDSEPTQNRELVPVLLPCVTPPGVGFPQFGCQDSDDVQK